MLMDGIRGLLRRCGGVERTRRSSNRRGSTLTSTTATRWVQRLPCCYVVVTDKAIASHHRTGLSERLQAVALAQLSELDQHLYESDVCLSLRCFSAPPALL